MESEVTNLDEVVVVGYGTSSIKDLTGSVASVGLKQLSQLNTPNVTSMLQNLAAGVQVSQNTGVPGETVRVRVRGATSLTGSNEPLYVIDGVPVEDPSMLDAISPNDIQSMDVLKDASAAAIYGSASTTMLPLMFKLRTSVFYMVMNGGKQYAALPKKPWYMIRPTNMHWKFLNLIPLH